MCVVCGVYDACIIFLTLFTFCIFIVASSSAAFNVAFVAFNQLRRVGNTKDNWEGNRGDTGVAFKGETQTGPHTN